MNLRVISMDILFSMKLLETLLVIQKTVFGGTVNILFNFSISWKLAIISLKFLTKCQKNVHILQ